MTEVLLPTWIIPEEETHEWLDEGSAVFGAAFAPGIAQRQSFGGLRLKMSRRHTVRAEEKAQLLSILQATRGRFNALRTKVHFALRGSGLGTELVSNNTFANGTTGWTSGSEYTLSVADRIARGTRNAVTASGFPINLSNNVTVTQYAPYVTRFFVSQGRGAFTNGFRINDFSSGDVGSDLTGFGLKTQAYVPRVTSYRPGLTDREASGLIAGDYVDVSYASITRCAIVDNGQNLLLQSDELDTTWTATRSSVDDQTASTTAPDGTSTADSIIEDATAATTHFVQQANITVTSAAADFAFSVAIKAGTRTTAAIQLTEQTDSTSASAFIDLSDGDVVTGTPGTNWTNSRAFSADLGNGWYKFTFVSRKTNAATQLTARILLDDVFAGTLNYDGNGTGNIYAWRATLAQSSVPTRLVFTTTTASTGTSQTGNALYVKGLPASTSGLLLPGDWIEIGGELKQCTAALNSDAAGLGYLQFEPALVRSPADSDPIIVTDPMGKFLVSNIQVENQFGTQAVVTYDLEHIYE